jgi:hypothetical protein
VGTIKTGKKYVLNYQRIEKEILLHASAFSSETRYTTIKNNLFMEKPNESRRNKLF